MPQTLYREHSMRGKMYVTLKAFNDYGTPGGIEEGNQYVRTVYIGEGSNRQKIGTLRVDTDGTQFDRDHVFFTPENYEPGAPVFVENQKVGRVPATSPTPLDDFTPEEAKDYIEDGAPVGDEIAETLKRQQENNTGIFAETSSSSEQPTPEAPDPDVSTTDSNDSSSISGKASAGVVLALLGLIGWALS